MTHSRCDLRRASAGVVCLVALFAIVSGTAATRAASAPVLQPYTDPSKHFSIQAPVGWHVKRDANGFTTFYQDDPTEGTSLAVWLPASAWKGEVDASAIMKAFLQSKLKSDPDLKIVGGRQRKVDAQTTVAQVILTWTNPHKVALHGYSEIDAKIDAGKGFTSFSYRGYQAPVSTFDGLQPTFVSMLKSFTLLK